MFISVKKKNLDGLSKFYDFIYCIYKFCVVKRLGKIHFPTGSVALKAVVLGAFCRKENNTGMLKIGSGADAFGNFKAVNAGHHYIKHDDIRLVLLHLLQGFFAICGFQYLIALVLNEETERYTNVWLVIDE